VNDSLGLSCVFVQGLLLYRYAYAIPTLGAIPGATLQAKDHHCIARRQESEVPISTDRHSITLTRPITNPSRIHNMLATFFALHSITIPQLVDISIPSTGHP